MASVITSTVSDLANDTVTCVLTSTTAASAVDIAVGFVPREIRLVDCTTGNEAKWVKGMVAANSLTMAAATGNVTVATTGGFAVSGTTVTIPAALQPAAGATNVVFVR